MIQRFTGPAAAIGKRIFCLLLLGFVAFGTVGHAQGNSGKTKDDKKDKPSGKSKTPIPYVSAVEYFVQGASGEITVFGEVAKNFTFHASQGNEPISAFFSNSGISIDGIFVVSDSELLVSFTVSADCPVGGSLITVTNPKADPSTSVENVIFITDVPEIVSADINPKPLSVVDDLSAVFSVKNVDETLELDYEYEWFESDSLDAESETLLGESSSVLSSSKTKPGKYYRCVVKPIKGKSNGLGIPGKPGSSPRFRVNADADGNGIHDAWEVKKLGQVAVGADSDSDGDGYSNRAEYLFGLDPQKNGSERPIAKPWNPASGSFGYTRASLQLEDVRYNIEISTDLNEWTALDEVEFSAETNSIDDDTDLVEVKLAQSIIDTNPKLFVRVSVN